MDILRGKQDRSPWNKWVDTLGLNYTAPVDYELEGIFKPGFHNYLQKVFGLSDRRQWHDEEALMRVMDMQYGKSQSMKATASHYLKSMAQQGLIDDPLSWKKHFNIGDPNNYLNTFASALNRKP